MSSLQKGENKTKELILKHFKRYPKMQLEDMFKFLFHSAFGCDHLVESYEKALAYINYEFNNLKPTKSHTESLDGNYSRVYLGIINKGLSKETLAKLFYLSAKKEEAGPKLLKEKLLVLESLILNNELPFNHNDFCTFCAEWEKLNYPAIHHSKAFNQEYTPSYRVIANKYLLYFAFIKKIDSWLESGLTDKTELVLCSRLKKQPQKTLEILREIYSDLNINLNLRYDDNNQITLVINK